MALVSRAKAQLPPRAAVDDGDAVEDILDRAALLAKPTVVGEEVFRRGMGGEQPERLGAARIGRGVGSVLVRL
jgi:hypothetical protein